MEKKSMSDEKELTVIDVITCFVMIALMVIGFFAAIIGIELFMLVGTPYILYALSMGYITNHELFLCGSCAVLIPTLLIRIRTYWQERKKGEKKDG